MPYKNVVDAAREILNKHLLDIGSIAYADYDEPEFYSFPQLWSDSACGGGGMGGQMLTNGQTYVVRFPATNNAVVFVGKAYPVIDCNELFWDDLHAHQMKPYNQRHRYECIQKNSKNGIKYTKWSPFPLK